MVAVVVSARQSVEGEVGRVWVERVLWKWGKRGVL